MTQHLTTADYLAPIAFLALVLASFVALAALAIHLEEQEQQQMTDANTADLSAFTGTLIYLRTYEGRLDREGHKTMILIGGVPWGREHGECDDPLILTDATAREWGRWQGDSVGYLPVAVLPASSLAEILSDTHQHNVSLRLRRLATVR